MQPIVYACVATFLLFTPYAYATPLFFRGLVGSYMPGATIDFDVGLPALSNLGAYNVDVLLTSTSGVAGVDFFFDLGATVASESDYVFPSTVYYFDAANVDSPSQHRLTLSDFNFSGTDVAAGVNDLLAHVVIQTTAGFSGEITLSFDLAGLLLDTPDLIPTPVAEYGSIVSDTQAVGASLINLVPEPTGLMLLLAATGLALGYSLARHRN
jgi:hypothetical protein